MKKKIGGNELETFIKGIIQKAVDTLGAQNKTDAPIPLKENKGNIATYIDLDKKQLTSAFECLITEILNPKGDPTLSNDFPLKSTSKKTPFISGGKEHYAIIYNISKTEKMKTLGSCKVEIPKSINTEQDINDKILNYKLYKENEEDSKINLIPIMLDRLRGVVKNSQDRVPERIETCNELLEKQGLKSNFDAAYDKALNMFVRINNESYYSPKECIELGAITTTNKVFFNDTINSLIYNIAKHKIQIGDDWIDANNEAVKLKRSSRFGGNRLTIKKLCIKKAGKKRELMLLSRSKPSLAFNCAIKSGAGRKAGPPAGDRAGLMAAAAAAAIETAVAAATDNATKKSLIEVGKSVTFVSNTPAYTTGTDPDVLISDWDMGRKQVSSWFKDVLPKNSTEPNKIINIEEEITLFKTICNLCLMGFKIKNSDKECNVINNDDGEPMMAKIYLYLVQIGMNRINVKAIQNVDFIKSYIESYIEFVGKIDKLFTEYFIDTTMLDYSKKVEMNNIDVYLDDRYYGQRSIKYPNICLPGSELQKTTWVPNLPKPSNSQNSSKPSNSQNSSKPSNSQNSSKPSNSQNSSKPSNSQNSSKPSNSQNSSKPSNSQKEEFIKENKDKFPNTEELKNVYDFMMQNKNKPIINNGKCPAANDDKYQMFNLEYKKEGNVYDICVKILK